MSFGNKDDKSKADLTRLEALSEFLHVEDPEIEDKFNEFNIDESNQGLDEEQFLETIIENSSETQDDETQDEEINFTSEIETPSDDTSIENNFNSPFEFSNEAIQVDPLNPEDNVFDFNSEGSDNTVSEEQDFYLPESEVVAEAEDFALTNDSQEKFEDVKNFVSNFSYGLIEGGGNPPFTVIIRNIKYESDAEDIITILRDFEVINDENRNDTLNTLSTGSYIIPQISEYSAIILAHKLRRFDCDLEVGLSDEIRTSKFGDSNPRGLVKKETLRQNKRESYKKSDLETPIQDIIVTTMAMLEGHTIQKYIGVKTSFAIIDEEELERLKFVQKVARANLQIHSYDTEEAANSEKAFKDYQTSFEFIFNDLCDQLKLQAVKEKANALLGLSYQLTSLPFEKSLNARNCFQITCSATMAIVQVL